MADEAEEKKKDALFVGEIKELYDKATEGLGEKIVNAVFEEKSEKLVEEVINAVFDACEKCMQGGLEVGRRVGHELAAAQFSDEIKSLRTRMKLAGLI